MKNRDIAQVRKTYNRLSGIYDFYAFWGFPNRTQLYKKHVSNLNILKEGDIVVDLCCGTGLNFRYLQSIIGSKGKIIAFDLSENMLNQAKKKARKNNWQNIEFIQGNALEVESLVNEKVDIVFTSLALCVLNSKKEVLKKISSLLKPNGNLILIDVKYFDNFFKIFNPFIVLFLWATGFRFDNLIEKPWLYAEDIYKIPKYKEILFGCCYIFNGAKN